MRLKLNLNLENENLPIQYRKSVISFIKLSLSEYNEEYYKKFYNKRDNIIKPYTFSVFFKSPQFKEDEIIIKDKRIELNISIADYETSIIIYNAFNHQKNKKFPLNKNSWTLKNINMIMEKEIVDNELDIRFMSPLVVRSRINKKDYYYSFKHEKFEEMLKINIKEEIKNTDIPEKLVDTFSIEAVNAKKAVIKFYEKQIETSLGVYKLKGNPELLDYLYKAGIGSKRSSGFGMFSI